MDDEGNGAKLFLVRSDELPYGACIVGRARMKRVGIEEEAFIEGIETVFEGDGSEQSNFWARCFADKMIENGEDAYFFINKCDSPEAFGLVTRPSEE